MKNYAPVLIVAIPMILLLWLMVLTGNTDPLFGFRSGVHDPLGTHPLTVDEKFDTRAEWYKKCREISPNDREDCKL